MDPTNCSSAGPCAPCPTPAGVTIAPREHEAVREVAPRPRTGDLGTNPVVGFLRTLTLLVVGRVRFVHGDVGRAVVTDDGRRFRVFRHVLVRPGQPEPRA